MTKNAGFKSDSYSYFYINYPGKGSISLGPDTDDNLSLSYAPNASASPATTAWIKWSVTNCSKPLQPMFSATLSLESNVTGDNTIHHIGSVTPLSITYNQSGNLYAGDGSGTGAFFTAPVAGFYIFAMVCIMFIDPSGGDTMRYTFSTTLHDYVVFNYCTRNVNLALDGYNHFTGVTNIMMAPMDAGDTISWLVQTGNNSKVDDIITGYVFGGLLF